MNYDFILLGAGAAGFSLALALAGSPLSDRSILLIDRQAKTRNDRTWCYWTDAPSSLDVIRYRAWERIRFQSERVDLSIPLAPYRYQMIRGIDFYRYAHETLAAFPNIHLMVGNVEAITDGPDAVEVAVDGETYRTAWVFDSRLAPADLPSNPRRYHSLKQHFTGWEIEAPQAVFEPASVTLFDLRTPQQEGVCFFYILPFDERRALVEYTLFSAEVLPASAYAAALREYLADRLGLMQYRVLEEESGVIPMTDYPFPRRLGQRILATGTRGGRVKPSTGYAFARIQRDSQAIVESLLRCGHPFDLPPDSRRHRFHDRLMLNVMAHEPGQVEHILEAMFARNPIRRALRFLDDQSAAWEDLGVITSVQPWPFLRALGRLAMGRPAMPERTEKQGSWAV